MAETDEMTQLTIDERRKYLKRMRPSYEPTDSGEQGELLSEMEQVTGLHRKSLLRLLHAPSLERQPRRRQRGTVYGAEVERVVVKVWASLDFLCAERLTPSLGETGRHLAGCGVVAFTEEVSAQLAQIREASVAEV